MPAIVPQLRASGQRAASRLSDSGRTVTGSISASRPDRTLISVTEPWEWTEAAIRASVGRVRAGRSLAPGSWPGGSIAAVALSFDSDHETVCLRQGDTAPGKLSQGEYGARAALPRILALLDRHELPVSFYVPVVCALLRPAEVRGYADSGHEVALHGWIHERNAELPPSVERDLTLRAADTLEQIAGRRPVGIRTPSWDFSQATLSIIGDLGLAYDSSLMADDDPYEIDADGEPTGIVEIPVEWIRDDAPYFPRDPGRPLTPPRAIGQMWRDEFDRAYAERGLFQLTMHPHVIGHRARIVALEQLIDHIKGHQRVWFATHAAVAAYVADQAGLAR
jgi:peptidoglycan/xylan/chitin deacetylase (PgdA/CDA1 family)